MARRPARTDRTSPASRPGAVTDRIRVAPLSPWGPGSGIAVLFFLSLAAVGRAQDTGFQTPDPPQKKPGTIHVGPFYLSPALSFTAGVDNNVYNSPIPTADQSIAITPGLQAVLPVTRRARLIGRGAIVPQYFHREESQRYTDVFGSVTGEVDIGPFTVFAGVGGGRYHQRFSLEIDERVLRHEHSDTFGGTLHLGSRMTVTGSHSSVKSTFDPGATLDGDSISRALDRDSITDHAEVAVPLTRKTSLVPSADLIDDRFLQEQPGLPPHVHSQRYLIGFRFSDLAFFNGHLAAGVRHFGSGQGVVPYDGPVFSIDLGMPFFLGTRLYVSSDRDVAYSASAPDPITSLRTTYVNTIDRAELLFELPWRLHGRAGVEYDEADYIVSAAAAPSRSNDHAWTVGGALLRHLGRHLSLGVSARHGTRLSQEPGRTYAGTIYGLAGEVAF